MNVLLYWEPVEDLLHVHRFWPSLGTTYLISGSNQTGQWRPTVQKETAV